MDGIIPCPLCSQPGFSDIDSLRLTLISVSTRRIVCPICQEVLLGLDKFTIHLVSHSLHDHLVRACLSSNVSAPLLTILKENETSRTTENQFHLPLVEVLQTNLTPSMPQYILVNFSPSLEGQTTNSISQVSLKSDDETNPPPSHLVQSVNVMNPINQGAEQVPVQESIDPSVIHNQETLHELPPASKTEHQLPGIVLKSDLPNNSSLVSKMIDMNSSVSYKGGRNSSINSPMSGSIDSSSQTDAGNEHSVAKERLKALDYFVYQKQNNIQQRKEDETDLLRSCSDCRLKFNDESIALLHQQLVHDHKIVQSNISDDSHPSVAVDLMHSLKIRTKKVPVSKLREHGNSVHKYPCHQCSKVFRMRGSLMVHLRVAHAASDDGPSSLTTISSSDPSICVEVESALKHDPTSASVPPLSLNTNLGFVPDFKVAKRNPSSSENSNSLDVMEQCEEDKNLVQGSKSSGPAYLDCNVNMITSVNQPSSEISKDTSESNNVFKTLNKNSLVSVSPTISPVWSPTSPSSSLFETARKSSVSCIGAHLLCVTCNKSFAKEALLVQHMKSHESKQWECDVCAKLFTTKYFLKKHKRLHTGEMPYTCGICNKSFTFQQSYHKHLLYHSDDKPHTCSDCGRAFKELSTLHNHQRIHTGEKPWACETCGKCFRQRVSYLVHRRIHTGAMPYQCTACLKSFRYKVSQRTHKCTAQPPGDVVRQSDDLLQRLLSCSLKQNTTPVNSNQPSPSEKLQETSHEEYANFLKEQLQQLNIKQEKTNQHQLPAADGKAIILESQICGSGPIPNPKGSNQTDDQQAYQQECKNGHSISSLPELKSNKNFSSSRHSQQPCDNLQIWPVYENQSPFGLFATAADQCEPKSMCEGADPSTKIFESSGSSSDQATDTFCQQEVTSQGSSSRDLLQDILSMVMTPSDGHSQTLSVQNNESSDKYSWDADPESELHSLFYGTFDS